MRNTLQYLWVHSTIIALGCSMPGLAPIRLEAGFVHKNQDSTKTTVFSADDNDDALLLTNEHDEIETEENFELYSSEHGELRDDATTAVAAMDDSRSDIDPEVSNRSDTDEYHVTAAQPTAPLLPALMDETTLRQEAARTEASLSQFLQRARLAIWEHPEFERALYNPDGLPLADIVRRRYEILSALPQFSPVDGWISSPVGRRHVPGEIAQQMHKGVDIAAAVGTTVFAPGDGVVRFAGPKSTYGNYIAIVHGYGVVTKYAHNSKLLVKAGDRVKTGDPIATVGESGRVRGAHLHYEVWLNDRFVNPLHFMQATPAWSDSQTRLAADHNTP